MHCNKCNLESENLSLFCKDKTRKSGYKNWCKGCIRLKGRDYRRSNPDKMKIQYKERYEREKNKYSTLNRRLKDPIKYRAWEIRHSVVNRNRLYGIEYDNNFFDTKKIEAILRKLDFCPCCGCRFDFLSDNGFKNMKTPSIDRLDSKKGYIKSNMVFICCKCNLMKNESTIEDLERLTSWLRSRLQKEP